MEWWGEGGRQRRTLASLSFLHGLQLLIRIFLGYRHGARRWITSSKRYTGLSNEGRGKRGACALRSLFFFSFMVDFPFRSAKIWLPFSLLCRNPEKLAHSTMLMKNKYKKVAPLVLPTTRPHVSQHRTAFCQNFLDFFFAETQKGMKARGRVFLEFSAFQLFFGGNCPPTGGSVWYLNCTRTGHRSVCPIFFARYIGGNHRNRQQTKIYKTFTNLNFFECQWKKKSRKPIREKLQMIGDDTVMTASGQCHLQSSPIINFFLVEFYWLSIDTQKKSRLVNVL